MDRTTEFSFFGSSLGPFECPLQLQPHIGPDYCHISWKDLGYIFNFNIKQVRIDEIYSRLQGIQLRSPVSFAIDKELPVLISFVVCFGPVII